MALLGVFVSVLGALLPFALLARWRQLGRQQAAQQPPQNEPERPWWEAS